MSSLFFATVLFASAPAMAFQYDFLSRYDHYSVNVTHGKVLLNGRVASSRPFAYVLPLFRAELDEACGKLPPRADLTIIRHPDKNAAAPFFARRLVYYKQRIVSNGRQCAQLSGQGLYLLPLSRKWFTSQNERLSIALGNRFSVIAHGKTIASFRRSVGSTGWQSVNPDFNANWDFVANFISALHEFPVDFRAAPGAGRPKTKFILNAGGRRYVFEEVAPRTWAVRFPHTPWMVASGQFGVFGSRIDSGKWLSPYNAKLKIVENSREPVATRVATLNSLPADALPALQPILATILDRPNEPFELQIEIIELMREVPSMRNMSLLINAMNDTKNPTFLNAITQTLRIRNPHGPVIVAGDNSAIINKKISEWRRWQATVNRHD